MAKNGNIKWKSESLLIAAQNYVIRTNYVKAKRDKQQNIRRILCGDGDEIHNKIHNKGMQQSKKSIRLDITGIGKVIHCELYGSWNLTILIYSICTIQKPSRKMRRIKSSAIFDTIGSPNITSTIRPCNYQQKVEPTE